MVRSPATKTVDSAGLVPRRTDIASANLQKYFLLDRNIGPFCTTEVGVRRCGTLRPAMESKPDFQLAVTIFRVL